MVAEGEEDEWEDEWEDKVNDATRIDDTEETDYEDEEEDEQEAEARRRAKEDEGLVKVTDEDLNPSKRFTDPDDYEVPGPESIDPNAPVDLNAKLPGDDARDGAQRPRQAAAPQRRDQPFDQQGQPQAQQGFQGQQRPQQHGHDPYRPSGHDGYGQPPQR